MKKFLFFASAFATVFASCSDDNSSSPAAPMVKKMTIVSNTDDPSPQVLTYNYSGNVLSGSFTDGLDLDYIYESGQMTAINTAFGENSTGQYDLVYDGTAIDSLIYHENGFLVSKLKYHHQNGNVSQVDEFRQIDNPSLSTTENYFWNAGNLDRFEFTDYASTTNQTMKLEYTYDNGKNAFINMPGFTRLGKENWGYVHVGNNSVTSVMRYEPIDNPVPMLDQSYNFVITYNADQYPVEVKKYRMSDNELISTVTFEYE